jgi:misacylated tRNA(Ala) deacylase
MSTDCLFREDSYLKDCSATVVALTETGGIVLDRTIAKRPRSRIRLQ